MQNPYFDCEEAMGMNPFDGGGNMSDMCSSGQNLAIAKMLQIPPDYYPIMMPAITIMTVAMKEILSRQCMASVQKHKFKLAKSDESMPSNLDELQMNEPSITETIASNPSESEISKPIEKVSEPPELEVTKPPETEAPKLPEPEVLKPAESKSPEAEISTPKPPPLPPDFVSQLQTRLQVGPKMLTKKQEPPATSDPASGIDPTPTTNSNESSSTDAAKTSAPAAVSLDAILAKKSNLKKRSPDPKPPGPKETPNPIKFELKPVARRQSLHFSETTTTNENVPSATAILKPSSIKPSQNTDGKDSTDGPISSPVIKLKPTTSLTNEQKHKGTENMDPKLRDRLERQMAKAQGENSNSEGNLPEIPKESESNIRQSPKNDAGADFRSGLKPRASLTNERVNFKSDERAILDPKLRDRLLKQKQKAEGMKEEINTSTKEVPNDPSVKIPAPEALKVDNPKPLIASKPKRDKLTGNNDPIDADIRVSSQPPSESVPSSPISNLSEDKKVENGIINPALKPEICKKPEIVKVQPVPDPQLQNPGVQKSAVISEPALPSSPSTDLKTPNPAETGKIITEKSPKDAIVPPPPPPPLPPQSVSADPGSNISNQNENAEILVSNLPNESRPNLLHAIQAGVKLQSSKESKTPSTNVLNANPPNNSDLLEAIRAGVKLKSSKEPKGAKCEVKKVANSDVKKEEGDLQSAIAKAMFERFKHMNGHSDSEPPSGDELDDDSWEGEE